jgi:hypothetical protein
MGGERGEVAHKLVIVPPLAKHADEAPQATLPLARSDVGESEENSFCSPGLRLEMFYFVRWAVTGPGARTLS